MLSYMYDSFDETERMVSAMWGMIIGMISGLLMSVQGVFNTEVTKQTSVWISAGFVQLTALIVCMVAWFVSGRESSVSAVFSVRPWYMLSGGIIGAFITYTVILAIDQLGPARATMFIVAAQLVVSYLISLFGMFGVEKTSFAWTRLLGILVMVAGILLFKWQELFPSGQ